MPQGPGSCRQATDLMATHVAVGSVLPTQGRQGDLGRGPGAVQTTTQRHGAAPILSLVK